VWFNFNNRANVIRRYEAQRRLVSKSNIIPDPKSSQSNSCTLGVFLNEDHTGGFQRSLHEGYLIGFTGKSAHFEIRNGVAMNT
jgi:hypothetical protein